MIKDFLKTHWLAAVTGNVFALALGFVSAVLGVLLGPSIQLLIDGYQPDKTLAMVDLFGERFAAIMTMFVGVDSFKTSEFFRLLPGLLIAVALFKAVLGSSQWYIWEFLGERLSLDLRARVVHSYLKVFPQKVMENPDLDTDISSLVSSDIRYVREYVVRFFGGLPREAIQVLFLSATLLMLSPKLFALFIFGVAPVLILISRLGKRLRKKAKQALKDYSSLTDWLQQRLMGIETIKHYGTEDDEVARMAVRNQQLYRSLLKAEIVKAATSPLIELVAFASIAFVLYYALRSLMEGTISSSVQLSFFGTLALLSQAGGKLGKYYNTHREAGAALQRIQEAVQRFEGFASTASIRQIQRIEGAASIDCAALTFSYKGRQEHALSGFSYRFEQGNLYCIAGVSGAGKSTLMRLLLGSIIPNQGKITIHAPVRAGDDDAFGYLPQKPLLIADTIFKNIIYPHETGDQGRVLAALDSVKLKESVLSLEQGLDALVGLDGHGLSGGQEQRIHLARVFYHGYPIILIDEGTSALDPETEALTFNLLREKARNGALVIMIAHRNVAFTFADQILLFDQGRLAKAGSLRDMQSDARFRHITQYTT